MKFIIAFLLLISSAFAGHTVGIRAEGVNESGQKYVGRGSAVVLDKTNKGYWVAVTAKHCVRGAGKVSVGLGGQWHQVTGIYPVAGNHDAAFITFIYDADLEKAIVADEDVPAGEDITWSGFSAGSKFEKMTGRTTDTGFATCQRRPQQGQSGGGVYDRRGRLIGIVSGYDQGGNLVYEPIGRVRRACRREWGFAWGICVPVIPVAPVLPVAPAPPQPNVIPRPADVPPPAVETEPAEPAAPPPPDESPKPIETPQAGCKCKDGCKCDLASIKADIEKLKATKIPVQILRADGTIFDQAEYRLGSPIKLKLAPVKK